MDDARSGDRSAEAVFDPVGGSARSRDPRRSGRWGKVSSRNEARLGDDVGCGARLAPERGGCSRTAGAEQKEREQASREPDPGKPSGTIVASRCSRGTHAESQCNRDATAISAVRSGSDDAVSGIAGGSVIVKNDGAALARRHARDGRAACPLARPPPRTDCRPDHARENTQCPSAHDDLRATAEQPGCQLYRISYNTAGASAS